MAVMGLADGLLAGFNTMNHYQRGQKADERAERELGLRDAMIKQNQMNVDRDFEFRDQSRTDSLAQQKLANERWDRDFGLREKESAARQREASELSAFRRAQESRAAQNHALEMQYKQDQMDLQGYMPTIEAGMNAAANGQDLPPGYAELMNDKRFQKGGRFYYLNTEQYRDTSRAKSVMGATKNLISLARDVNSGAVSWADKDGQDKIVSRLNEESTLAGLNTVLQHEIERGIGHIDEATGKKITGKRLSSALPTEDGRGVMFGLEVTYEDGSKANKVVTEGRGSSPGENVKVMPFHTVYETILKRASLYKTFGSGTQQDEGYNQDALRRTMVKSGMAEAPDVKGYRQAVVKVQADSEKAISQIRRDSMLSSEEKEGAIASEREAAQQQLSGLRDAFGLTPSKPTAPEEPAGQQRSSLSQWVGHDPMRQAFLQDAIANGRTLSEQADPAMLDAAYGQWVKRRQDSQTAQSLRGGNSEALAQPDPAKPDPRAAEKAALNALVDPFKNTPTLNNKPDGLAALQAMYSR